MGMLNSGGWQYYNGPSPMAAGADAFGRNFLDTYLSLEKNKREERASKNTELLQALAIKKAEREESQRNALMADIAAVQNRPPALSYGNMAPADQASFTGMLNEEMAAAPDTARQGDVKEGVLGLMSQAGVKPAPGTPPAPVSSQEYMDVAMRHMPEQLPTLIGLMSREGMSEDKMKMLLEVNERKNELSRELQHAKTTAQMQEIMQKYGNDMNLLRAKYEELKDLKKMPSISVHVGSGGGGGSKNESEMDKAYDSYLSSMKAQGKTPLEKYRFQIWYDGQKQLGHNKTLQLGSAFNGSFNGDMGNDPLKMR